ncbi:MAG: DUF2905 domain-containing protein [Nitrospirae bacterium]|nr:DUF2905 domain-containing protein [Nitrospirota bacterium]
MTHLGKMMMMMGVGLLVIGGLLLLLGKWQGSSGGGLGWLGRLPGDIFIKRDNFSFYFPLTTSIILSIVGSALLYFFLRR